MELTPELIRKHKDRLLEVTVKGYQKHSKTGKVFSVRQHERKVQNMSVKELNNEIKNDGPQASAARRELKTRGIGVGGGTKTPSQMTSSERSRIETVVSKFKGIKQSAIGKMSRSELRNLINTTKSVFDNHRWPQGARIASRVRIAAANELYRRGKK